MTINTKDIEALVDQHCSSIHPIELNRLLEKLDYEDLHVLKDMLEEVYNPRQALDAAYLKDLQEEYYDKGYSDGYEEGQSNGETSGYHSGYEEGKEHGFKDGFDAAVNAK